MSTDVAEDAAIEFLGELERAEAELLSWGLVDGRFSSEELRERAEDFLDRRVEAERDPGFMRGAHLLKWLEDHRLLWPIYGSPGEFRTRMGEAVRLLSRLRQIFPGDPRRRWREAPTLVADFRLLLRPRAFPRPHIKAEEALDRIRSSVPISPLQVDVLKALLRANSGRPWELREFQVDAAARVLKRAEKKRSDGTIVCAGTGSGKTMAFYLPAFMALAQWIGPAQWTKCLALYPRNELLKDQLREALGQSRRVNQALAKSGKRKLSIGVLYGDVPQSAKLLLGDAADTYLKAWERTGKGFRCPVVNCPDCGGPLLWIRKDVESEIERLRCTSCPLVIESDEIRLTRDRMLEQPPDVLFTSTEILNQRMASGFGRLFGVGTHFAHTPRLILLDEVHTYQGVHGAHVALLLRRWRKLSGAQPHFVGLSATLADARRFFATLAGLNPSDVEEISPRVGEITPEGMEYLLALRGDPVSPVSLLSTTIQAAMLLRRVLEPQLGSRTRVYGRKVFAFTDNLDVNNRLFHNLEDAEGWFRRGVPKLSSPDGSLANLRASSHPAHTERLRVGQSWDLAEWIGHPLQPNARIEVGRTSSQDAGVDASAGIIVATASLEVGFDDPEVGAVLQHKAPKDPASFVQRKGRAGRRREMRPWTVVVLSDYGRDRIAYQGYEQLFSPELSPRYLPTENRYVLRIQAAYALIDWLADEVRRAGVKDPDPWFDLSGPADKLASGPFANTLAQRQALYVEAATSLLTRDEARTEFASHLAEALDLKDDAVQALLWEPPRALLTVVVPTLLRRLERRWQRGTSPTLEPFVKRAPLTEFVPRALFGELNLPEVMIDLPNARSQSAKGEWMPIRQALQEFAPGRVSRRFGVWSRDQRHWIEPPEPDQGDFVFINDFCDEAHLQDLGDFSYEDAGNAIEVPAVRPYRIRVTEPPAHVKSSSNAFLRWKSQLISWSAGVTVDLPSGSVWRDVIASIRFHTHNLADPAEARRFAIGADVSIATEGNDPVEGYLRFGRRSVDPNGSPSPIALGFTADVDAMVVSVRIPERVHALFAADAELVRGLRPAFFRHLVLTAPELSGIANRFQRGWLSDIFLSALSFEALERGIPLEDALEAMRTGHTSMPLERVLDAVFQTLPVVESDDEEATSDEVGRGHRHQELIRLLRTPDVLDVLHRAAAALWEPMDERWEPWLRARFKATLGTAILATCESLCAELNAGDLYVDVDHGPPTAASSSSQPDVHEIWFTEATVGGAAYIEELLVRYGEDPRRFFHTLESILQPSDFEEIDGQLKMLLRWISSDSRTMDPEVRRAVSAVREARSHRDTAAAFLALRKLLGERGMLVCHSVLAAVNARVLRPGSSESTDRLLSLLVDAWQSAEERLGIEIDARTFAYTRSRDNQLDSALGDIESLLSEAERPYWRFGTLYGLLWPRGSMVRAESLKAYNPFASLPASDRRIVLAALQSKRPTIDLERDDWFNAVGAVLIQFGSAVLSAPVTASTGLREALQRLAVEPIDTDALLVHARVRGVRREPERLFVTLDMPEAAQ